jgi:hypothetical protein
MKGILSYFSIPSQNRQEPALKKNPGMPVRFPNGKKVVRLFFLP